MTITSPGTKASISTRFGVVETTTSRSTDVVKPPEQWGPEEVRDYVVRQITQRFGTPRRDAAIEVSIFRGFCARWGDQAGVIARYAFDQCQGRWNGGPIRVERFSKNSDPWFAEVIVRRL